MRIQNNITAQNSHRQYNVNQGTMAKSTEKLSSGYRVNRAADDAAGLAISEKMRTQIRGLSQAGRNVQDGISLLQVADGALQEAHNIVQRMRELAVQAANGTNDDPIDRKALDLEYQQLMEELDSIANNTNFNGVYPLKGNGMLPAVNTVMSGTAMSSAGISANTPAYGGPSLTGIMATQPTTTQANAFNPTTGTNQIPIVSDNPLADLLTSYISISGSSLTVPSGGGVPAVLQVNASDLAGITNITVPAGSTLIINGTLSGNIDFAGDGSTPTGQVRINGNITGSVTNRLVMTVAGSNSGTIINETNGRMIVEGNNITIAANRGDMRVMGTGVTVTSNASLLYSAVPLTIKTNEAGSQARLAASDCIIGTNNGNMFIAGSGAKIDTNNYRLQVNGSDAEIQNNTGDLYLSGNYSVTGSNTGTYYALGDHHTINSNSGAGTVYVDGDDTHILSNSATVVIDAASSNGPQYIDNNSGSAYITSDRAVIGTNTGELGIAGNDATVTNNNQPGQLRISGNDASIQNNRSIVHIIGDSTITPVVPVIVNNLNPGKALIDGNSALIANNQAGGEIRINGNNGAVTMNRGTMVFNGDGSKVSVNSGNVRIIGDSAAEVTSNNGGRLELTGTTRLINLAQNTGLIHIEALSSIIAPLAENEGTIEVADDAILEIRDNTGRVINWGMTYIFGTNSGYLEAGKWEGDDITDVKGYPLGFTLVNTNAGTIRNFSENLVASLPATSSITINNSGGTIENYGTLASPATGGTINHHARQTDTTGITATGGATITFHANGKPITLTGAWAYSAQFGSQLIFDEEDLDNGKIVHNASSRYDVADTGFGMDNRTSVYGSRGTSATKLIYIIEEDFLIQSGANEGDTIKLDFRALNATYLGQQDGDFDCFCNLGDTHIRTIEDATCAIGVTAKAINDISLYRAELGAQYNRLEYTYDNIGTTNENQAAAESRIRDLDMAKEMTVLTKNNILVQSSTAMLAQANALPQGVLQLLS